MWQYNDTSELYHFGIKGMKWGKRKKQDDYVSDNYYRESDKKIITNKDGSRTVPTDFVMNRVGKKTKDINQSGALYVSYGKEDASRYVKNLGPTPIAKLFNNYGEAVQHIRVKEPLNMPSDKQVAITTANLLLNNKGLRDNFNKSLYSMLATDDGFTPIDEKVITKALVNPTGKEGQKLSYAVSSFLGDPNYANESKIVYERFRSHGYDAIPDVHDKLSGTSKDPIIIMNPNKVEITETTPITKRTMKEAKQYVKSIEKLKSSEMIK
jgi:hypothetical protein